MTRRKLLLGKRRTVLWHELLTLATLGTRQLVGMMMMTIPVNMMTMKRIMRRYNDDEKDEMVMKMM